VSERERALSAGASPLPGRPLGPVEHVVSREADGARLDRFVAGVVGVSRSELARWIEAGRVTVDGVARDPSTRVREGQRVRVDPQPAAASAAQPESGIRFDVMYVDDDIVVLDKPAGLVVHPARGHATGTLVNGLLGLGLFRREDWVERGTPSDSDAVAAPEMHVRPGIVHRLDKGTSGVMVVARHPDAREALKAQFQVHSIERAYEGIVAGEAVRATIATLHGRNPHDRLRFTTRVASGKRAVTHVRVIARLHGATHVECKLETGRTHQIRVHMAETGTPVLGDPLYGRAPRDPGVRAVADALGHQALHARRLGFVHPRTGASMRFDAPPPLDFMRALAALAGA
jgi:23S rRNA pseudouridine1911/1915/1917 synthase